MLRRGRHTVVKNLRQSVEKAILGERHVIPTICKIAPDLFLGLSNLSELP